MWKWTFKKLPNSRAPIRLLHKILAVPAVLELLTASSYPTARLLLFIFYQQPLLLSNQGRNRAVVRYGISVPFFEAPKAPHRIVLFFAEIEKIQRKT